MKVKKVPMRKCSGCGEMFPKKELVRVVRTPDKKDEQGNVVEKGTVVLDLTSKKAGRGAYVCKKAECLKKARKARRIERSLSTKIPDEVYDAMERELADE
ncbi:MAG: YlxR family protein [Ruminococcus sp.]|nr:YlxR family protein [Ruminococcus sp.]